jgi:hypothetical protein
VQSDRVRVASFEGLYDEESLLGISFNINERKHCLFGIHYWVNAGLEWRKTFYQSGHPTSVGYYVELRSSWPGDVPLSYGNIRLCRRCKRIDCYHLWEGLTENELAYDAYYSEVLTVARCHRCGRRVAMGRFSECHPTQEALDLVNEVVGEAFSPLPEEKDDRTGPSAGAEGEPYSYASTGYYMVTGTTLPAGPHLGSGFYVELPVLVSRILATLGREDAVAYIRACIKDGMSRYVSLSKTFVPVATLPVPTKEEPACLDAATGRSSG